MSEPVSLITALLLGFFSSTHCLGMCGGIMGALTLGISSESQGRKLAIMLGYNLGRITSYTFMGAVAGLLGYWLLAAGAGQWLRFVAAGLLVLMALYLTNWWRALIWLEKLGQGLWRYVQPLGKRLLPVRTWPQSVMLGALWGWLPCGLVYTALTYAMTQPGALSGALTMLAFGLGTLPALLAAGFAAGPLQRFVRLPALRHLGALLLLVFAGWTFYGALGHGHDHDHSHPDVHSHSEMMQADDVTHPHSHH